MPKFRFLTTNVEYGFIDVEADDIDEAREKAEAFDGDYFVHKNTLTRLEYDEVDNEIMRTTDWINNIDHEALVDLFSTALSGSTYLACDYEPHPDLEDCECIEDKLAKSLLNGREIFLIDAEAEGESYGNLPCETSDDEYMVARYTVTLEDIKEGLYRASRKEPKAFASFMDRDNSDWDYCSADTLMQVILFGELIYG